MENGNSRRRLLELASERGTSLAELSRMIGRNATYLQQFVRKGSPRKLEEGDRSKLARFFAVDEAELGGPQEKYASGERVERGEWIDVPRLPLGVSAGPGAFVAEERPIGAFRFSRRWLREHGFDPAMLSAVLVEGDSMEPTLRDRDEILVDRTPRPVQSGIHVLRLGDTLLVKRIDATLPGRLVLKSDNASYDPIEVAPEDAEFIGRVVWKGGRL